MSLVGLRLSCIKSSTPRLRGISLYPQNTRSFSFHSQSLIQYSHGRTRSNVRIPFDPTPLSSLTALGSKREFSIWPFAKTTPSPPASEAPSLPSTSPLDEVKPTSVSAGSDALVPKESVSEISNSLPEGLDPSPTIELLPPDAVNAAVNVADVANSIPPPLQFGDLASMGLISWTPAGLIRWTFELINVSTGLSWLYTIILGTLLWRILLLPVAVKTLQFSSRMSLIQPQTQAIMARMMDAKAKNDLVEIQRCQTEQLKLYKDVGIHPLQGLLGPVAQLPVAIGMFLGIKKMCELPVPQLQFSGFEFLPDLTAVDPTGLMAPAFAVTMFWQMTVTARDMDISRQPGMAHVMNLMRFPGAPLFALFMNTLPSGLVMSIIVAAVATGLQSIILRIPAVRRYFNILPPPQVEGRTGLPSFKDTFIWLKTWWRNQWTQALEKAEQQKQQQNNNAGPPRRRL